MGDVVGQCAATKRAGSNHLAFTPVCVPPTAVKCSLLIAPTSRADCGVGHVGRQPDRAFDGEDSFAEAAVDQRAGLAPSPRFLVAACHRNGRWGKSPQRERFRRRSPGSDL